MKTVLFSDNTTFFKLFGIQLFTKTQIQTLIEDLQKTKNCEIKMYGTTSEIDSDIKSNFIRLVFIGIKTYKLEETICYENLSHYRLIFDGLKGKNGVYAGYFIFQRLDKDKHKHILYELQQIIKRILGDDCSMEIRLKKFNSQYLWKLLLSSQKEKKLVYSYFQSHVYIFKNIQVQLMDTNSIIINTLEAMKMPTNLSSKSSATISNPTPLINNDKENNDNDKTFNNILQTFNKLTEINSQMMLIFQNQMNILQKQIQKVQEENSFNTQIILTHIQNNKTSSTTSNFKDSTSISSTPSTNTTTSSKSTQHNTTSKNETTVNSNATQQAATSKTNEKTSKPKSPTINTTSKSNQFFDPKNIFKK